MEDNDINVEICDECSNEINCNKRCIFIIIKGEEDKVLCQYCFEDLWKEYSNNGWSGDDIEYYLELEKENEENEKL
jgi:hypothetical protein